MKNWTIGKRITFGFATILVLVTALAATSFVLLKQSAQDAHSLVVDQLPCINSIHAINNNISDSQLALLETLTDKTPEELKQHRDKVFVDQDEIEKAFKDYEAMLDNDEDTANFKELTADRDAYTPVRDRVVKLMDDGKKDEAMALFQSKLELIYNKYSKQMDKMSDWNQKDAGTTGNKAADESSKAKTIIVGTSIAVVVLGIIFAVTIIIGLKKVLTQLAGALNDGSSQVTSAAGQVSASSQSLAEGASEQAASLEETSSSLEEMASMTKRNSESAQKANDLAKQARAAADKGSTDMQAMSSAMEAIKVSSDDIAKIIKTIDEIAFQTNILALNAAVEAARAGEAGMGFAVVADEVRNLAQRSAQAAKETAAKIEGAITKTGQGVEISGTVVQTLNDIVAKVRQVDELISEVAGASREQTQGITQINTAVGQMDKVTQSNAANAEESAAAAEELNAQAATMKESVTELLQLVGGSRQTTVASTTETFVSAKETRIAVPKAKRPAPIYVNGHAHPEPATAGLANGRTQIPLEGEFKDF